MKEGGTMPCVLNAANEIAVQAFLQQKIGFLQIADCIMRAMENIPHVANPDVQQLLYTDNQTRKQVEQWIEA
jgi:1-deoxy-D-xylulose-5-phosphate reductoisomerase